MMNIFKHKSRYGRDWVVEQNGYVWGIYPTLKSAKNNVRWSGDGAKAVRRMDMDFKTNLVWQNYDEHLQTQIAIRLGQSK